MASLPQPGQAGVSVKPIRRPEEWAAVGSMGPHPVSITAGPATGASDGANCSTSIWRVPAGGACQFSRDDLCLVGIRCTFPDAIGAPTLARGYVVAPDGNASFSFSSGMSNLPSTYPELASVSERVLRGRDNDLGNARSIAKIGGVH